MTTLTEQLTKIVKSSKIFSEDIVEDEDNILGTIDKYLNESVAVKCKEVLEDQSTMSMWKRE